MMLEDQQYTILGLCLLVAGYWLALDHLGCASWLICWGSYPLQVGGQLGRRGVGKCSRAAERLR